MGGINSSFEDETASPLGLAERCEHRRQRQTAALVRVSQRLRVGSQARLQVRRDGANGSRGAFPRAVRAANLEPDAQLFLSSSGNGLPGARLLLGDLALVAPEERN